MSFFSGSLISMRCGALPSMPSRILRPASVLPLSAALNMLSTKASPYVAPFGRPCLTLSFSGSTSSASSS